MKESTKRTQKHIILAALSALIMFFVSLLTGCGKKDNGPKYYDVTMPILDIPGWYVIEPPAETTHIQSGSEFTFKVKYDINIYSMIVYDVEIPGLPPEALEQTKPHVLANGKILNGAILEDEEYTISYTFNVTGNTTISFENLLDYDHPIAQISGPIEVRKDGQQLHVNDNLKHGDIIQVVYNHVGYDVALEVECIRLISTKQQGDATIYNYVVIGEENAPSIGDVSVRATETPKKFKLGEFAPEISVKRNGEELSADAEIAYDEVLEITIATKKQDYTQDFDVHGATEIGENLYKVTGDVIIEYFEDGIPTPDKLIFEVFTDSCSVYPKDKNISGVVVIPGYYEDPTYGLLPTYVEEFNNCPNITELVLCEGAKICYSLKNCTSLTKVKLPSTLEVLATDCFAGCQNLTTVNIPEKIKKIPSYLFNGLSKLTNVELSDNIEKIEQSAFNGCINLTSIKLPANLTTLMYNAFYNTGLTSVTIPDKLKVIGANAFKDCHNLTSVDLGNVEEIELNAFSGCNALKDVKMSKSLTIIGPQAFWGCRVLKSITLPKTLTTIEQSAFYGCSKLVEVINESNLPIVKGSKDYGSVALNAFVTLSSEESKGDFSVNLGDGVEYYVNLKMTPKLYLAIDLRPDCEERVINFKVPQDEDVEFRIYNSAFYRTNITNIVLPENTISIGDNAFYDCDLSSVDLPRSVEYIGKNAFADCQDLKYIYFKNLGNLTTIGDRAFWGCSIISDLRLPMHLQTIGEEAFTSNDFTSVTLPAYLTSIGTDAFSDCYYLIEIVNQSQLPITLGSALFGKVAYYADFIASSESKTGNFNYVQNGIRYYKNDNGTTPVLVALGFVDRYDRREELTLDPNTKSIGYLAFCDYDYKPLTTVTLPEGLTKIGVYAFSGCLSLKSVSLPSSLTWICEGAFNRCKSLTTLSLPNNLKDIGDSAFYDCAKLSTITLPENLKTIGNKAFNGCTSLKTINIPASVQTFGNDVFKNCQLDEITIDSAAVYAREWIDDTNDINEYITSGTGVVKILKSIVDANPSTTLEQSFTKSADDADPTYYIYTKNAEQNSDG